MDECASRFSVSIISLVADKLESCKMKTICQIRNKVYYFVFQKILSSQDLKKEKLDLDMLLIEL